MRHNDRVYHETGRGIYASGAIERGIREGHRLRAEYVRSLFGKSGNNADA